MILQAKILHVSEFPSISAARSFEATMTAFMIGMSFACEINCYFISWSGLLRSVGKVGRSPVPGNYSTFGPSLEIMQERPLIMSLIDDALAVKSNKRQPSTR